jgi:hypothetical protein
MNIRNWRINGFQRFAIPVIAILFVLLFSQVFGSQAGGGEYLVYLPIIQSCEAPSQPLLNGGFEQGTTGWSFDQYSFSRVVNSVAGVTLITPHSGNWMADVEPPIYGFPPSYIEQVFTVPECSPYVVFWWSATTGCSVVSGSRCGSYLTIVVNDSNFRSISGEKQQPWEKEVLDLSGYEGMTIQLRFANTNVHDATYIAIDDISFEGNP